MKIAHEAPISIFRMVRDKTDYDYALLHLFKEQPEYLKLFQESSKMGREILLDNSLFELGDAMTSDALAEGIELIKPTWYVVPDALNDLHTTVSRWEQWEKDYGKKYKGSIGVVQGSTWDEFKECYKFMAAKADKVAITGLLVPFFDNYGPIVDSFNNKWMGRTHIIREMMREGIWNFDIPHHILGATNPIEFADPIYTLKCFDSVDTSSPVMAGLNGIKYINYGLKEKPKGKLFEHILDEVSEETKKLIDYNITDFRKIVNHW